MADVIVNQALPLCDKSLGNEDSMKVIGLTGGVGTGKSTVVSLAEEKPYVRAVKADEIGHFAMELGQSAYNDIITLFGDDILNEDKTINRKKVAEIVFADNEKLSALNGIIHPFVRNVIETRIEEEKKKGECKFFIIEAAILLETGYQAICDEIWVVITKESLRRQRLKESRGYSEEKITAIMKEQMPDEEFIKYADVIIENNESLEIVKRKLDLLLV